MYKIQYYPEVKNDFEKLSDEVLIEVVRYIKKLKNNPFSFSLPLYGNLSQCRKIYVHNAQYRIIIKIEKNIAKIVQVVAIGKRQNKEVYFDAYKRVKEK